MINVYLSITFAVLLFSNEFCVQFLNHASVCASMILKMFWGFFCRQYYMHDITLLHSLSEKIVYSVFNIQMYNIFLLTIVFNAYYSQCFIMTFQ